MADRWRFAHRRAAAQYWHGRAAQDAGARSQARPQRRRQENRRAITSPPRAAGTPRPRGQRHKRCPCRPALARPSVAMPRAVRRSSLLPYGSALPLRHRARLGPCPCARRLGYCAPAANEPRALRFRRLRLGVQPHLLADQAALLAQPPRCH